MAKNPWHKRVQCKAAAMRAASASVAEFIAALEERALHDLACAVREKATRDGDRSP
jgi:uncharacterized protein with von Willebrand factor type A (vWA) domain